MPQFPQLSNSNNSVIHFHVSDKFLSSSYCAVPGAGHWEYGTMNKHRTPGLHKGRTGCKQPTNKEKQDLLWGVGRWPAGRRSWEASLWSQMVGAAHWARRNEESSRILVNRLERWHEARWVVWSTISSCSVAGGHPALRWRHGGVCVGDGISVGIASGV